MTRWPAIGRCKRRLSVEIGSNYAASIQRRLIHHTIQVGKDFEQKSFVQLNLSITGIGSKAAKKWSKGLGIKHFSVQVKGSLGLRMRKEVIKAKRSLYPRNSLKGRIIIIGTDLPSLCKLDLLQANHALQENDLVLGPSEDGGYWLIGMSGKLLLPEASWPFSGIPWGTEKVLTETIARANRNGIDPKILRLQNDIDQSKDLFKWHNC